MKQKLFALTLVFLFSSTNIAFAEDKNMGDFTCREFLASPMDIPYLMFWVDGYMSAQSDNLVLSPDWMKQLTEHYMAYCSKNPEHTLIDAMSVSAQ